MVFSHCFAFILSSYTKLFFNTTKKAIYEIAWIFWFMILYLPTWNIERWSAFGPLERRSPRPRSSQVNRISKICGHLECFPEIFNVNCLVRQKPKECKVYKWSYKREHAYGRFFEEHIFKYFFKKAHYFSPLLAFSWYAYDTAWKSDAFASERVHTSCLVFNNESACFPCLLKIFCMLRKTARVDVQKIILADEGSNTRSWPAFSIHGRQDKSFSCCKKITSPLWRSSLLHRFLQTPEESFYRQVYKEYYFFASTDSSRKSGVRPHFVLVCKLCPGNKDNL